MKKKFEKYLEDYQNSEEYKKHVMCRCTYCFRKFTTEEFMSLESRWVDEKEHKYGKDNLCPDCNISLFTDRWHIVSMVDGYLISTIDLGIPHAGMGIKDWTDYNYWYETMFQNPEGDFNSFQQRYKTQEEAIEGHKFVVEKLPLIILHPDLYPKGIIDSMCEAFNQIDFEKKQFGKNVKEHGK